MRISIIVCVGNEKYSVFERQDAYHEAIQSYLALADELIVVNGSSRGSDKLDTYLYGLAKDEKKITKLDSPWPYEWDWKELPKHLNQGYALAQGDWVIRCDIDYVFHENDIVEIRDRLNRLKSRPVATFQKYGFTKADTYYEKGGIPLAINKWLVGDTYGFGQARDAETDLCYPIKIEEETEELVYFGSFQEDRFGKVGLPVYNYDCTFRTQKFQKKEFWRFSKAYYRHFKKWPFGSNKDDAFEVFTSMMQGRYERSPYKIRIGQHPCYIQSKLQGLAPEQFGYNGWGSFV